MIVSTDAEKAFEKFQHKFITKPKSMQTRNRRTHP